MGREHQGFSVKVDVAVRTKALNVLQARTELIRVAKRKLDALTIFGPLVLEQTLDFALLVES